MSFIYKRFYRDMGIRKIEHLLNPVINNIENIVLPFNSIYHYLPEDSSVVGMPGDHWVAKTSKRLPMSEHIVELSKNSKAGDPRKSPTVAQTIYKNYHKLNRKIKLVRDLEKNTRDKKTPLVINYALLPQLYRYKQSMYKLNYKRSNIIQTFFDNIVKYSKDMDRQHFVEIPLPKPLPTLTLLRKSEDKITPSTVLDFESIEHIFVLELWRWLGANPDSSMLKDLNDDVLKNINLILRHENKWVVLNLGVIYSWRKSAEEVDDGVIKPDALQKRFLKILISLFESVSEEGNGVSEIPDADPNKEDEIETGFDLELDDPINPDSDIEVKKVLKKDTANDKHLEEELDVVNSIIEKNIDSADDNVFEAPAADYKDSILNKAEDLARHELISPAEYMRFKKMAHAHESLPNPYTGKGSLLEAIKISKEDIDITTPTKFADNVAVIDKSMLETTLDQFNERYVEKILPKDIMGSVLNFSKAGVAITNYEVERVEDICSKYEIHTVKVNPVLGKSSTVRFRVPVIDKDGTYMANGIRYRMRKQRVDAPIRKIKDDKVALTSYYGKVFVERSGKSVHNYARWLLSTISAIGLNSEDNRITGLKLGKCFKGETKTPRLYSILASKFMSFNSSGIRFFFEVSKKEKEFTADVIELLEKDGFTIIGKKDKLPVVVDQSDSLYLAENEGLEPLGIIEDILKLDHSKAPIEIADLTLFSKRVPLGFVLGYYFGLDRLIKSLEGNIKRFKVGEKYSIDHGEFTIVFDDEVLVVNRSNKLASLLLGGFNVYRKSINRYSVYDFNNSDIYYNVFTDHNLNNRHLKELDLLKDLFIDPITLELLKEMKEPDTWCGLLKKAGELLLTDYAPTESNLEFMRIRGYERIAGAVYKEMVNSMRTYVIKEGVSNSVIDMNPFAVWQTINGDPSISLVEEANPIRNINEKELVTFSGVGGRSNVSMVARTRLYSEADMGTISEATTDDGKAGATTYTTANPKFNSLRGTTNRHDPEKDGSANMISTCMLLSPAADVDVDKRVNFITIHHGQGIGAKGYKPTPLRTGYESVIAERTDDIFASTAKEKGKVTKVSDKAISVEYSDGSVDNIQLGVRIGVAGGAHYKHPIVTNLKEGDKVKKGDLLAYNEVFFEPNPLDPKRALWKAGVMCKTAILENSDTLEDSSIISMDMAKRLGTETIEEEIVFIAFDQTISNMVKVGDDVQPDTILCTIEDQVTSDNKLFSDDTLETLALLSGNTPRAKYTGKIEKIEVLYYGDVEDMSDTVSEIAINANKKIAAQRRALKQTVVDCSIGESLRLDNKLIEPDTLVIKFYITKQVGTGGGDKVEYANQLKSVLSGVMSGTNKTESGEDIDAMFGYVSIFNRNVLSPEVMGTTNTLLSVLSKHVAKIYKS